MSRLNALAAVILSSFAINGCAESQETMGKAPAARAEGLHTALRVKMDSQRGRRWELGWGAAFAYDASSGQLIRRIPLADATLAGARIFCRPDLLVSRSGAVIVSSNVEPVLWRIDPDSFEVRRYAIVLDSDLALDFGFSALAWDADEKVLYAASAIAGTLWRIDLDSATAMKIALTSPIRGACALSASKDTAGTQLLFVAMGAGEGPRHIALSSDLNRGEVTGAGERSPP